MIEEIVLKSACLVNENSWSIDNWLTLGSIIITAIFSRMMWYVAKTQKDIQEKQKNLELFKLRFKHKQNFISIFSQLMTTLISTNVKNVTKSQQKILEDSSVLMDFISESKYLFNQEVFEIESRILRYFNIFSDILDKKDIAKIEKYKKFLSNKLLVYIPKLRDQHDKFLTEAKL